MTHSRVFFSGLWLIVTLELRQRVRGASWYVLLGVFMLLVGVVTFLLWLATSAWLSGGGVFSTIIFFALLGTATQQQATNVNYYVVSSTFDEATGEQSDIVCSTAETTTQNVPRFDYFWWILAANPYVVVADAAPGSFNDAGYPTDLFGQIAVGVRSAQSPPELYTEFNGCDEAAQSSFSDSGAFSGEAFDRGPTAQQTYDGAVPSWFIGLFMHVLLGAGALAWAWRRTRTPALHLPTGSRIA